MPEKTTRTGTIAGLLASIIGLGGVLSLVFVGGPQLGWSYLGPPSSQILASAFLALPVGLAVSGLGLPRGKRAILWKASASILGAGALGLVGEAIHTAGDPCTGFLGYPEGPHYGSCFHPPGFWLADFNVLALSGLLAILVLWTLWEIVRTFSPGRPHLELAPHSNGQLLSRERQRIAIALGAALLAVLASLLIPVLNDRAWFVGLPYILWQFRFILLFPLLPALVGFAFLEVAERKAEFSVYPATTSIGVLVGALLGILTSAAVLPGRADPGPLIGMTTLLAAYTMFSVRRVTDTRVALRRGRSVYLLAGTVLYLLLAGYLQVFLVVVALLILMAAASLRVAFPTESFTRRRWVPSVAAMAVVLPLSYYWALVWSTLRYRLLPPWSLRCQYKPFGASYFPWPRPGCELSLAVELMTQGDVVICVLTTSGAFIPLVVGAGLLVFWAIRRFWR